MFGFGDFLDKSRLWFLKNLKLASYQLENFKLCENALGQFIPNSSAKHVITSANNVYCSNNGKIDVSRVLRAMPNVGDVAFLPKQITSKIE